MRLAALALTMVLSVIGWTAASAQCPAPSMATGNIDDVISYAACVKGCGLDLASPAGDVCVTPGTRPCPALTACISGAIGYYVNGFDLTHTALAYEASTNTLFLGYRVVGLIGDNDGNGNPNTAGGATCQSGQNVPDQSGIGTAENYVWSIDTNCDGTTDIDVTVSGALPNPTVSILKSGTLDPIVGASGTAIVSGSDLKVRVTGISDPLTGATGLPPGFTLYGSVGSFNDGLSDEFVGPLQCSPPNLSIDIEKSATPVTLCPGASTHVSLAIHNTSDVALTSVTVTDDLPAGLQYVANSTTGCGAGNPTIASQKLTWTIGTLAADQSCTLEFDAQRVGTTCFGTVTNHSTVAGTFQSACVAGGVAQTVTDFSNFDLVCVDAPHVTLGLTCRPDRQCAGGAVNLDWSTQNTSLSPETIDLNINGTPIHLPDVPAGATRTGTVAATMPSTCPSNGIVTFSGTADATNSCPAPTDGTAHATASCNVTCIPPPLVECTATPNPTKACKGTSITITGTAKNTSGAAEDIVLTIDGTDFSFTGVTDGQTVSQTKTVTMPACTDGQKVPFVVSAVATNATCPNNATCSKTAEVECQKPEVQLQLAANPADGANVDQGGTIHYTITVTNPSTDVTLENVIVTDTFQEAYANNANPAPTTEPAVGTIGGSVVWNLASLAPQGTATFTFDVTVENRNPCAERNVVNRVTVTGECAQDNATQSAQVTHHVTCPQGLCRITGGGCLNERGGRNGHKENTFGGNVSPAHDGGGPTGNEWEHVRRDGRTILFNFHSHDAHIIACSVVPPGPCSPQAVNTKADFEGTGQYSLGSGSRTEDANFSAYIIDHKEGSCNKNTRDIYSITVRKGLVQGAGDVVFSISGEIDCGNLQIHETPARIFGSGTQAQPEVTEAVSTPGSDLALLNHVIPNPFTNTMSYSYKVSGAGQAVKIGVYDMAGRMVRTLQSGWQAQGQYTVKWDSRDGAGAQMAPGVYFLRAHIDGQSNVSRVVLLKR